MYIFGDKHCKIIIIINNNNNNNTWGAGLQNWFKKMIKKATRVCNVPSSSLTSYWTQTIAVALQKRVSKAQIISANRVYAVRHLEKIEDMNSYHMENHMNWENQGNIT